MAEYEINARHLFCPMPVIRTQDAIAQYNNGDLVHVFGTDPGMKQDIPAWCRMTRHTLVAAHHPVYTIRKQGDHHV